MRDLFFQKPDKSKHVYGGRERSTDRERKSIVLEYLLIACPSLRVPVLHVMIVIGRAVEAIAPVTNNSRLWL